MPTAFTLRVTVLSGWVDRRGGADQKLLPHRCYTASTKSLSTPSLRGLMRASLLSVEEDPDMPGKEGDLESDIQSLRNVPTVR